MRRVVVALSLTALVTGLVPLSASAQSVPPAPARDQWYASNDDGHWSDGTRVRIDEDCLELPAAEQVECSLAAFEARPFTVIAFVDSGINPYHEDFRAPDFVHHPSAYIDRFPADAEELELSFDLADSDGYDAARAADEAPVWSQVDRNELYWFPGTRIIGGYSSSAGGNSGGPPWANQSTGYDDYPILDDQGHGTGVASVAAGQFYGSNPNALIVMVEGLGDAGLSWATRQPWIDIVSNSWGNLGNVPLGNATITRDATRRGQSVVFSGGNGTTNRNSHEIFGPIVPTEDPCKCKFPDSNPSVTSPYGGPSWLLTVGAASPVNGQAHWWHSVPVDVVSFGSKWRAAAPFGVTREDSRDFGGTSCAAPTTAGVLSAVIQHAREVLGDTTGGQRPGQVVAQAAEGVELPDSGPLADGQLTRAEAEEIVQKTALPVELADPEQLTWDYAVRPTTPAYYTYQGYGLVDNSSKQRALAVLMGEEPLPERGEVDDFIELMDTTRDQLWGSP